MRNKIFWGIIITTIVLSVVGCGKKSVSGTDRSGIDNTSWLIRDAEEFAEEVLKEEVETYAFDGLEEKCHEGMTIACNEIGAEKENIRNFTKESSDGDEIYSFEYGMNKFSVEFNSENIVKQICTEPDKIAIYKDGYVGFGIAEFCVQEESVEKLKEALTKSFEAGVDISDFDLTYDWETCTMERIRDYYIIRVDGLATYKVNERRAEPQIRCDLVKNENTYAVLYLSVQNGERINEYGKIQVPELSFREK